MSYEQEQEDFEREYALRSLRAVLEQAAQEAAATQGLLQESTAQFNAVSNEVIDVVGGSAQGVDKEMVQSMQTALSYTNSADVALSTAASTARFAV